MCIEDKYSISGRGICVTGRIGKGEITKNDYVFIDGSLYPIKVLAIEKNGKLWEHAAQGEVVGLLLDSQADNVQVGTTIYKEAKANSFNNGDLVQNIKQYIQSIDFSRYCNQITQNPTNKIINKFSNWFTLDIGTPLLSLDSTYQFLLTTEYLFWWDDCEGCGYLPLDHVIFYTGEDDFDGVYVMDKDWDIKGGFIIDDDIARSEKKPFIEDMTRLITYILRQKNAD